MAQWLESRTRNPKVVGSSLRSSRNCRWGEWMYSALSTLNTTTEVSLSKALNPQLLPGRRSINGCPLLRVCVHGVCVCSLLCVCTLDGINAEHKFRVWVTILGHMSRHFHLNYVLCLLWGSAGCCTDQYLFVINNVLSWQMQAHHVHYSWQATKII